jgi:hypothetical protein
MQINDLIATLRRSSADDSHTTTTRVAATIPAPQNIK